MRPESPIIAHPDAASKVPPISRLWRSNGFSIIVSAALHAALFAGFYQMAFREQKPARRIIIPEARLAPGVGGEGASPGPLKPGEPPKLSPAPAGATAAGATAAPGGVAWSEMPVLSLSAGAESSSLVGSITGAERPSNLGGSAFSGAGALTGYGLGTGGAAGGGGGGVVGAPATNFFGATGNAYKVVYVVDVSNSLMITLDKELVREMKGSIQAMIPTQQFHIILAKANQVVEFGPGKLVNASGQRKQEAMSFIENMARIRDPGLPDPVEAIRRAFDADPELIYFLSDGDYKDHEKEALTALVSQRSPRGEVKITGIAFGYGDAGFLERLARQTGGNFRKVDPK